LARSAISLPIAAAAVTSEPLEPLPPSSDEAAATVTPWASSMI